MSAANASRRPTRDTFCCQIDGLPKRYTWQALKDLARRQAPHGLFADVQIYPYVTGRGYIRAQRRNEVEGLYHFLTENEFEGQRLNVALWDISQPDSHPRLLKSNNSAAIPIIDAQRQEMAQIADHGQWQQWQAMNAAATHIQPTFNVRFHSPTAIQPYAEYPVDCITHPAHINYSQPTYVDFRQHAYDLPTPSPHVYQLPIAQTQAAPQRRRERSESSPVYFNTSRGTPVNISGGFISTETRGVFVSALNFKASRQDIEEYFGKAGEIANCELRKDSKTGKSKGSATIQYARTEDARRAIEMFNGKTWMNMKMVVRMDKEATRISRPQRTASAAVAVVDDSSEPGSGPLIVNGSGGVRLQA